jgi:hypothetical protein
MADASPSDPPRREDRPRGADRVKLTVLETWRRLNFEQRVAGVGALLLIVSTFGPFTFVEAAIVLIGGAVLLLLRRRAEGREFHIPFGDGAVIAAAGAWAALLIVVRIFDRPLGQGLLALVCAALLFLAGVRERAKRPADDLPPEVAPRRRAPDPDEDDVEWTEPVPDRSAYRDETLPLRDPPAEPPEPGEQMPLRPAKVLPPPIEEDELAEPPQWKGPRGEDA